MKQGFPRIAIVLAGGWGSRMLPFSKRVPKEMLPINGVPAIQLVVEECVAAGFREVLVISRPGDRIVREHLCEPASHGPFASGPLAALDPVRTWPGDLRLEVIEETPSPRYGSAAPLFQLRDRLAGEPCFAVAFADDVVRGGPPAIHEVAEAFVEHAALAAVACQVRPRTDIAGRFGNLVTADPPARGGRVVAVSDLLQRPALRDVRSELAVVSRLILTPAIYDALSELPAAAELDIGLAVGVLARRRAAARGAGVVGVALRGSWYTVGDPASYARAVAAGHEEHAP